jgi:N-acetylglucosaminyldiphosphoundecaprenol N-acetyl-beta-D-mannosaminyltransferase
MRAALKSDLPREIPFLGLNFSHLTFDEAIAEIVRRAEERSFSYVVTPNVDHVVRLFPRRPNLWTQAFRDAYDGALLRLCDSRVLQWLGRMADVEIPLVPGSDLTSALFVQMLKQGYRVAVVGGAIDTIAMLEAKFPGPEYVQHVPPMGVLNDSCALDDIVKFVARVQPNVTLFAFGSPQSEIVDNKCLTVTNASGIGLCIGASVDFVIGTQKRAPIWMQRAGMEWLYRLANDPARLWRRYLIEGPRIFWLFVSRRRRTGMNDCIGSKI